MAHTNHEDAYTYHAASAIGAWLPVKQLAAPSARDGYVVAAASLNDDVFGFTTATVASAGNEVAIVTGGIVKALAAASLGNGARVAVGSTNGRLVPIGPSGIASGAPAAILPKFVAGRSQQAAADGQVFSVMIQAEQIV